MTVNCVTGKYNRISAISQNINDEEVITRENTNTDLNLTKDDFNKSEMCRLLSADLEGVKLDAVITVWGAKLWGAKCLFII